MLFTSRSSGSDYILSNGVSEMTFSSVEFHQMKKFIIGICAGRPLQPSLRFLQLMGFNPVAPTASRDMRYGSNDYIQLAGQMYHILYVVIKSRDIITAINEEIIDAIMCYGDVWYNLPQANYNIKYIGNFSDALGETYVSLVGTTPDIPQKSDLVVASEYNDGHRLTDGLQCKYINVTGSAESYVIAGTADMAITVVQTGHTLEANNLYRIRDLRRIYLNLWINLDPTKRRAKHYAFYRMFRPAEKVRSLVIEGGDGTGKTTILKYLQTLPEFHNVVCYDRLPTLSKLTLKPIEEWPVDDPAITELGPNTTVVIIEAPLEACVDRLYRRSTGPNAIPLEAHESPDALAYFTLRYRELAAAYGYYNVENVNLHKVFTFFRDVFRGLEEEQSRLPKMFGGKFDHLPIFVEGESKIVRTYNDRFDIIEYKPSVYSHKRQRGGTVDGTNLERQRTTRNLMYLMAKGLVPHTYWYVYGGYILAEKIRDVDGVQNPPNVEVCVKRYHVGTHKHIYHNMANMKTRQGPNLIDKDGQYAVPIVRFDWRNPNHLLPTGAKARLLDMPHAQIFVNPLRDAQISEEEIERTLQLMFPHGIPLGDYALCEDLADKFINTVAAKATVLRAFETLESHFANMGIRFKDVCFMVTLEGTKIFGEVSQDCGRYELIDMDASLDKDVWRAGGSSELVLEKWKLLSQIVDDYVKRHMSEWYNEMNFKN